MRLIGTLENEQEALIFSQFLHSKNIPNEIEINRISDWGNPAYGTIECQIWISEEDNVGEALKWWTMFRNNPHDPLFSRFHMPVSSEPEQDEKTPVSPWENAPMGLVTRLILFICSALFIFSQMWNSPVKVQEKYAGLLFFSAPIEKTLLYDYPTLYGLIDKFIKSYGFEKLENPSDLPPEGNLLLEKINHTPMWTGIYHLLLKGGIKDVIEGFQVIPTFEKIREGEVWRLFSPALLHGDIFHLFFNMIWLVVLGKQMEQRLKPFRYILFILIVGIISNTLQYLMSGPNFIGFSGVLCGMLAFIWVRQKIAAWEGYQIDRLTLIFMLLFILGMALIQFVSFFTEKTFELAFSPNIANVAHLTGGLMGFILGRLPFFSWKHD